ncbi:MAG: MBL fold metallo-hydrolase [Holophagales bacterium]|nr:MAG: MBL fold metallo-hydrolase [Holophagales bacterium]
MTALAPCRITLIGAATTLIDIGPFRLLTDPVFDPPGGRYVLRALGLVPLVMTKTTAPAIPIERIGPLSAVLLSHDEHQDNLDTAGRALLGQVPAIFTTPVGARRLGGSARGLATWEQAELRADDGTTLRITATPARHGPPGSLPLVGAVTGFFLEWDGQRDGGLWVSGDTVRFRGLDEIGRRLRVHTALLHLGGARFALSGPVRYTMRARQVARVAIAVGAKVVVPIHYEGWGHFSEPPATARATLATGELPCDVRWVLPGETIALDL